MSANGPITTVRRLYKEPVKAASPHPLDQPMAASATARAGIEKAGT